MSHERAHTHAIAGAATAHDDDDTSPSRRMRTAQLDAPASPLASGLVQRRADGDVVSATDGIGGTPHAASSSTAAAKSIEGAGETAPAASSGTGAARSSDGIRGDAEAAIGAASSSSGAALPGALRSKFESSLGADLSAVRVHTGEASASAAQAVGAKAYALGQDIHFGAGHFDPGTPAGEHLLAHEVAHTVQQRAGGPVRQHKLELSGPGDAAEHDADRAADAMVAGRPASVSAGGAQVARDALPVVSQPVVPGSVDLGAQLQMSVRVTNPAPGKQYSWAWVDLEDRLLKTPPGQGASVGMVARPKAVGAATIGAKVSEVGAPEMAVESPQTIINTPPLEVVWGARVASKGQPPAPNVAYSTDQIILTAELAHVVDPEKAGVKATITPTGADGAVSAATLAWSGSKATWTVSGLSPGAVSYQLAIAAPGMAPLEHVETFQVVHDRKAYLRSIREAKAAIRTNFSRADIWAAHTSSAYVSAHKAYDDGLTRGKATQKLARDVMFGLCFAAIGGGAGAAATAWLEVGKGIANKVRLAALTDGVKDLFKYAVRLGATSMPALKPGNPNVEPASFYGELRAVLVGEQEALHQLLDTMEGGAEDADEAIFDHDPKAIVVDAMDSGELVGKDPGAPVAEEAYLAMLWECWINKFGYTVFRSPASGKGGPNRRPYSVQNNMRFGLEDEIRAAAQRCGKDPDAWLRPARDDAQAQVDRLNAAEEAKEPAA